MGRIQDALDKIQSEQHAPEKLTTAGAKRRQTATAPRVEPQTHQSGVFRKLAEHFSSVDEEHLYERRVIAASVHDDRVGPYRQLRTQLLKTMQDNGWNTLAITSAHEGAGKTLTAVNLAISLSKNIDTNVLLVDLDLETPTIHQVLNLNADKGLVDYLEGTAELGEVLFNPGVHRLSVLAGRAAGKTSSELLATQRMRHLIQDLCNKDATNITIFDLPPVLRNDDAIMFTPFADATLLVVEDGKTTEEQLEQATRLLDKANIIGSILNKART
jgi:capsular exopolysaccharide synthesis family protein